MNTELLREDELKICEWIESYYDDPASETNSYMLLQRLIEEREKNALLEIKLTIERTWNGRFRDMEAELAEARKDSERLDWLFKVGDAAQHSRVQIDVAMKEEK